jgi:hypothetical protein
MALELSTALAWQDPDKANAKRVTYEEGTQLSKLPKAVQDVAKELGLLRVHVTQPGEQSFDELYQRALDLGVIELNPEELEAAVRQKEATKAVATGFGAPTGGPQATDRPAGDEGGNVAEPLDTEEEKEASGNEPPPGEGPGEVPPG